MNKNFNISVFEILNTRLCFSKSQGQKVYERIADALRQDNRITISFDNVKILNPEFLTGMIDNLFLSFSDDKISLLTIKGISKEAIYFLNTIMEDQCICKEILEEEMKKSIFSSQFYNFNSEIVKF